MFFQIEELEIKKMGDLTPVIEGAVKYREGKKVKNLHIKSKNIKVY